MKDEYVDLAPKTHHKLVIVPFKPTFMSLQVMQIHMINILCKHSKLKIMFSLETPNIKGKIRQKDVINNTLSYITQYNVYPQKVKG